MGELWLAAGGVLVCLCFSFLFSGSETAMTASSKARLHALEANGDTRATLVQKLTDKKDRLIGALLVGNNLVNTLAASLTTSILIALFGDAGVVYATILVTVMLVILSEILPKSWAISAPERFALFVSPFVKLVLFLFGPLSIAANAIVRALLRVFGIRLDENMLDTSAHEELRGAVEVLNREGSLIKADRDRLGGLLDLEELEVADLMIHRTKVRSIDVDESPAEIVAQVLASPYTRMPVWREDNDNIIGILHAKDVLRALSAAGNDPAKLDVAKIMSQPWFVPDTTPIKEQLNAFLRRKTHMAIVVDEYGEMEGLVTLEDIIEEIIGDIADEHDTELAGVKPQPDGSVIVEGNVPIRDLNRALEWNLPDDEFNTIAGLVIHEAKTIPDEKQVFTFHGKRITVLKRDRNRIARLRIKAV
jgi:Mg2+/Co2+ transporter CorB